jgi:hypothetical protein
MEIDINRDKASWGVAIWGLFVEKMHGDLEIFLHILVLKGDLLTLVFSNCKLKIRAAAKCTFSFERKQMQKRFLLAVLSLVAVGTCVDVRAAQKAPAGEIKVSKEEQKLEAKKGFVLTSWQEYQQRDVYKKFMASEAKAFIDSKGERGKILMMGAELEAVIKEASLPDSLQSVKDGLDEFFGDKTVLSFVTGVKPLLFHNSPGLQAKEPFYRELIQKRAALDNSRISVLRAICRDHKVSLLMKPGNQLPGTFVLQSARWPGYLIKVPRFHWIDAGLRYDEIYVINLYQNVSRVLYNQKLGRFVRDSNLQHVRVVNEYLYHIPGQPTVLSDDNYIVVSEFIKNLPTPEENKRRFQSLVADPETMAIKPEYESLVAEIIQVITYVGFWDLQRHNVFLVDDGRGGYNVVFADTEKPGLGGGNLVNFFHKDRSEFWQNVDTGTTGFSELLKRN